MLSFRRAIGGVLLLLSVAAVVQTAREVWQGLGSDWTESPLSGNEFAFAGRTITIVKPTKDSAASKGALVKQELVFIDGVEVGAATNGRMSTWPFIGSRRSPHWFDAVKFVDRAARDSSLWMARRLQVADTVPPRFEIITLDATGRYSVQTRSQTELRGDYRLSSVTGLVGEDPSWEFPLSVVNFVWFPYLWLVFPIGTSLLGVILLRPSRAKRVKV